MAKIERTVLEVELTQEELIEKGKEASELGVAIENLEREKKAYDKKMNETINGKTQELNVLLHAINDGVEEREVECVPVIDYVNHIVNLTQGGKIIGTRQIREEDKQGDLLDDTEKEIIGVFDVLLLNDFCTRTFLQKLNDKLFANKLLPQEAKISDDPARACVYTAKNAEERDIVVKAVNEILGYPVDQTTIKMREIEKPKSVASVVTLTKEEIETSEQDLDDDFDDSFDEAIEKEPIQENSDLEDKLEAALTDEEKEEDEAAAKKAAAHREKELKKAKKK